MADEEMDINKLIAALDHIDDCLAMGEGHAPYPYESINLLLRTLVDAAAKNNLTLSEEALATIDYIETYAKQTKAAYDAYMTKSDLNGEPE